MASKKKVIKTVGNEYPYLYIGERIRFLRKLLNEKREEIANFVGITLSTYSLLESRTSATVQKLNACINFFAERHNINPAWIICKSNESIPMYLGTKKEMGALVTELNNLLKEQGLMVSLVPKV